MRRQIVSLLLGIFLFAFGIILGTDKMLEKTETEWFREDAVVSFGYREQNVREEMLPLLRTVEDPGKYISLYLLECRYGYEKWGHKWTQEAFDKVESKWKKQEAWKSYVKTTESIWNDVKYFPVPEMKGKKNLTVSYVNTWMAQRTYGGERGHEGTDLMASKNERGIYPIISMTDGVVSKKGWLDKGGYRIGIESPGGAYFYYAHLESYAALSEGDEVKAGDVLGYMGDSGYGEEGTVGQFPVHLHLGIYIYPSGQEVSVNPYWVLRYIENSKVKCYTEI